MIKDPVFELCDIVREVAFELHCYLKHGHLEKVYENGLANRLQQRGISFERQVPLVVRDKDGTVLGEYYADLVIGGLLIVEIKACRALTNDHTAQLIGYLRATGYEHGLLINFGSSRFEIKKYALSSAMVTNP